ncbi:MAG: ThuA domain-containing protein [Verrucomicrobia bacterium]|nr:ThuA domain-containing protein [Verrucomicrobiota bacterium]
MHSLRPRLLAGATFALALIGFSSAADTPPLRALLVTGGCCHDYDLQARVLTTAASKAAPVTWTIVNEGGKGTRAQIPLYDNPDWARPYDVIVHNECFADTNDPVYIRKITAAHRAGRKPAVVIHCAMHSYRAATIDDWREFLGVTSRRHDHQSQYPVRVVAGDHAALRGFPVAWTTPMDELYVIEKLWPTAKTLAVSKSEKDGNDYPVIWVNDYHGARVFGTTYGHSNATWHDAVFVDYVVRGLLWAAGRD